MPLKTHVAGNIFTDYIENTCIKITGLDPEIQICKHIADT